MKEHLSTTQQQWVVERYRKFIFGKSEFTVGTSEELLAEGKVEQLVREGRTPLMIGRMGAVPVGSNKKVEMQPFYEVPPVGFAPEDIKEVFGSMGVHVFVNKLGVKRFGDTFMLTEKEAEEVEERVKNEYARLGWLEDSE